MKNISQNISVVMISMNEELAVANVITDIQKNAPDAEIILVDSSSDRTPDIAANMGAHVIRQFPPKGYGNAMMVALKSASRDVIVTLDCDGTYPAEFIQPLALYVLDNQYDIVDGSRLFSKPKNMPWINYFGNIFVSMIASAVNFRLIPDLHSGMRAYSKKLFDRIAFDPTGAALPVELLLKPMRLGYRIKLEPIPYHIRIGESTMNPYETMKMSLIRIFRSKYSRI